MSTVEAIQQDLNAEILGLAVAQEQYRTPATSVQQQQHRDDTVGGYNRRIDVLRAALQQARVQQQYGFPL